ncbi:hypothetical protein NHX12_001720 [Muraenolepis orangiensis]|uniref:Acidic leucine-rich nuclear phosphoprotein 32 family member n=1 Tax=Muraenolepis orangiensis TaxID=630683 RepID=A0A9Q0IGS6_9TELE|nr:hypothetical protein NHX12_001720 [Muraenolepis orangiensis]
MDMKKRISMELGDRDPTEVLELDVHSCRSTDGEVEGLTDEYKELEFLSMVSVGLSSLAKLPPLPKLHKLQVNNNAIAGGLDVLVAKCPSLSYLNLCGNKIKDLAALEALRSLKSLQRLELIGCEVTTLDDYRESVFDLLPQIVYLDGFDPEDNEAPDSEEEDDDDDEAGPTGDGDDDDDEDSEGDDGSEGDEVGLSYLMKDGIQDEDDDDDYVDDDEDGATAAGVQAEKRKRTAEDEGDDDDDDDDDE